MKRVPLLLLAILLLLPSPSLPAAEGFKVITHPDVSGTQLSRNLLASIFLKQSTRWGNGHEIVVVDQSTQSPVRAEFSSEVLRQPLPAVQSYWLREISAGRATPPVVKASDADVVAFVHDHAGAIGYVSADFPAEGVKLVQVVD
jgi:ABC-type phosphate transport system substrate-binding protein